MALHMPSASGNTFDNFARDVGDFPTSIADTSQQDMSSTDFMASPIQFTGHDGFESSNIRGIKGEAQDEGSAMPPPVVDNDASAYINTGQTEHSALSLEDSFTDTNPLSAVSAMSEMSLNPEEMKGYAQLVFPDGEYLVTSTEIMLGRDERAQQILKEQEKRLRRERRELAAREARLRAAELGAQDKADQHKLPPSHASAQGDDDSDQLLDGRPAPGLPSTFSETGGIVNYEGSVDGIRRKRSKRRGIFLSQSSSTNSVAPASLHVYGAAASPWSSNEDSKCIFLPIHPFQAEDIRKISKEHLRIFYDSVEKHWKMEIKGNGAFVLNELYHEKPVDPEASAEDAAPRHFKRGDTVILTHNTEVLVTSLTFTFRLPQKRGISTFDSGDDLADDSEELSDAPLDLDDDSDGSDDDNQIKHEPKPDHQLKRPKITLKANKPAVVEELAEVPVGMGSKGGKKKPKEPGTAPEQPLPIDPQQSQVPPTFDANSTLQHVPVNELPEKRKGPGRPPKNGLVSKRDEGIIRRKMKEYEKRGERPPPYKDLLAAVRAENRAKELAAKAAARGEPMPANHDLLDIMPTTEVHSVVDTPAQAQAFAPSHTVDSIEPIEDTPQDAEGQDLKALQPQRTYRSPSPMKPKEEYTEEQLKRPTQTYYYILDEILSEDAEDAMELQQIYDKICKKYPFYKYVVESTGWQSSVRHNLKQNERFKPVSKQGKGWLWAIDPAVPLDKEKKKKPTPPPMPRPMHYDQVGSAQPGMPYSDYMQYGQPAYHQPTQQLNGHQQYRSPYSQGQVGVQGQQAMPSDQPAYNSQSHNQPQNLQQPGVQHSAVHRTISQPPSRPASHTPQPAAGPPPGRLPPAFQDLVEEIMRFRVEYLSPFVSDQAAHTQHERIFKRCVEWISQLHMRQNPEVKFENDEERRVFQILERMRHKFEHGSTSVTASQSRSPTALPQAQPTQAQPVQASSAVGVTDPSFSTALAEPADDLPAAPPHAADSSQQDATTLPTGPQPQPQTNGNPAATVPPTTNVPVDVKPVNSSPTAVRSTSDVSAVPVDKMEAIASSAAADSSSQLLVPQDDVQSNQQELATGVKRAAEDDLDGGIDGEKRLKLETG